MATEQKLLTKTKLSKIIKKYNAKLEQHDKEWKELCKKKCKTRTKGEMLEITSTSIYDHERHNAKGAQLFKDLMKEFEGYDIFPKK